MTIKIHVTLDHKSNSVQSLGHSGLAQNKLSLTAFGARVVWPNPGTTGCPVGDGRRTGRVGEGERTWKLKLKVIQDSVKDETCLQAFKRKRAEPDRPWRDSGGGILFNPFHI